MGLSEADSRAKQVSPVLRSRGWTEDLSRQEETTGAIQSIEAMAAGLPPAHGLRQPGSMPRINT